MAAPFFFIPGCEKARDVHDDAPLPAVLERAGLSELLRDVKPGEWSCSMLTKTSPAEGRPGLLLYPLPTHGRLPANLGYYPDKQTWRKMEPRECWIGFNNLEPPTPADLQRRRQIPGYDVRLGDENLWTVPALRGLSDEATSLPRTFSTNGDGNFKLRLRSEYQDVFDAFEPVAALFYDRANAQPCALFGEPLDAQGNREVRFAEAYRLCLLALGVNYRIENYVHDHLQLVGTETWEELFAAAVDWPRVELAMTAQKKSEDNP